MIIRSVFDFFFFLKAIGFSEPFFDRTWASGEYGYRYSYWTLALAGEAQCHFPFFGVPSPLILESQVEQPQSAWHRSSSSQQCLQEEKVLRALYK